MNIRVLTLKLFLLFSLEDIFYSFITLIHFAKLYDLNFYKNKEY